jgi:nitroreductase
LKQRRSVRHFAEEKISDSVLETILEAGIHAPFAAQLYSMVATRDPEKTKTTEIHRRLSDDQAADHLLRRFHENREDHPTGGI